MAVVWNNVLGKENPWRARYRVIVSMVYGTSWDGKQRQLFYGSYVDWLSEAQARHFLSHRLVERVPEELQASIDPAAPVRTGDDAIPAAAPVTGQSSNRNSVDTNDLAGVRNLTPNKDDETQAVENVITELKRLRVPATAGAPAARTALREAGFRIGNATVAAAVKERKSRSDAAPVADDEERFPVVVAF
jgi:hypothetical protein